MDGSKLGPDADIGTDLRAAFQEVTGRESVEDALQFEHEQGAVHDDTDPEAAAKAAEQRMEAAKEAFIRVEVKATRAELGKDAKARELDDQAQKAGKAYVDAKEAAERAAYAFNAGALRRDLEANFKAATKAASPPGIDDVLHSVNEARARATKDEDHAALARLNDIGIGAAALHIDEFASAKNVKGELLRPDFPLIVRDVINIVKQEQSHGRTITLQRAYDLARFGDKPKGTALDDALAKAGYHSDSPASAV